VILFFGSAGAGKSVQGKRLAERYTLPWVSTGELVRTKASQEVRDYVDQGNLASDEVMYELLHDELEALRGKQWILDGFPRTKPQADWIMEHAQHYDYRVDVAIVLDISPEEAMRRLLARGRGDDTEASITERVRVYHERIDPILAYLASQNVPVISIDAMGTIDDVFAAVDAAAKEYVHDATN